MGVSSDLESAEDVEKDEGEEEEEHEEQEDEEGEEAPTSGRTRAGAKAKSKPRPRTRTRTSTLSRRSRKDEEVEDEKTSSELSEEVCMLYIQCRASIVKIRLTIVMIAHRRKQWSRMRTWLMMKWTRRTRSKRKKMKQNQSRMVSLLPVTAHTSSHFPMILIVTSYRTTTKAARRNRPRNVRTPTSTRSATAGGARATRTPTPSGVAGSPPQVSPGSPTASASASGSKRGRRGSTSSNADVPREEGALTRKGPGKGWRKGLSLSKNSETPAAAPSPRSSRGRATPRRTRK